MEVLIIILILAVCIEMADSSRKWVCALGNGIGVAIIIGMGVLAFAGIALLFGLFGLAGIGAILD